METGMEKNADIKLLLVDDEDDFRRATTAALSRRGFTITEAADGAAALAAVQAARPDIVLLDLKMPGLSGIETLRRIREIDPALPVIILTGHGDFEAAVAGIKLEIVEFLQKPFDVDVLGRRIRSLLEQGPARRPLKERTIAELMVSPSTYPHIMVDRPVVTALEVLQRAFSESADKDRRSGEVRSALVYGQNSKFLGIIRFNDLLTLLLPPFLGESPYTTYFTGMFLAQCKVLGNRSITELVGDPVVVDVDAPLMEAIHLMVRHHLINLPVVRAEELVGILRGRDIILEVARSMGVPQ
jgi:CheY-like chemotaxis protein